MACVATCELSRGDNRGSTPGRVWSRTRNAPTWFFDYAITEDFLGSRSWTALFRISYAMFQSLENDLRPTLEKRSTRFRTALPSELKLAAFLLYAGSCTCETAAAQLGIGPSTVSKSVPVVAKAIAEKYKHVVSFPDNEESIALAMQGFRDLAGLPYCVGAVDGTHIKWLSCPEQQFYEYRCYKGYTSVVVFAVVTTDRKFIYVDIGKPGVLGDASIYERTGLKRNIDEGVWLGSGVPDLIIANIRVRPSLIGDCAFKLSSNMIKSCTKAEKRANPVLRTWDRVARKTRKPVECVFGILKNRFPALKEGVKLHHEGDIVMFVFSLVVLHNWSIESGQDDLAYLPPDEESDMGVIVTAESADGKRQRDTLPYYIKNEFTDSE